MKVAPIVEHLRRCAPCFGERVAGAAELAAAQESANLPLPYAFVVMTGDEADENRVLNGVHQQIRDTFEVVVALAAGDARGQQAAEDAHAVRAMLFLALVDWVPAPEYEPVTYLGCELVSVDRYRAWYRFEFAAAWTLGGGEQPETWHEALLDKLPPLEGFQINVDAIEPMADKNLCYPGPDGRIELIVKEDLMR